MKNIKNRGKALVVSGGLIFGGQGLEASAENCNVNYDVKNKMELVGESSKNEIVSDLTKYEEISRLYEDLKGSEKGRQLIEFYGSKQYIGQYRDKMDKLGSQKSVGEVIVKDKIQKILKSLEEDIKKNPEDFGYWDSNDRYLLDSSKVNELVLSKVNDEFGDYMKLKKAEENGEWITFSITYAISTLVMLTVPCLVLFGDTIVEKVKTKIDNKRKR